MLITRGLGESEEVTTIEYVPVPVCEPEMTSHEVRERCSDVCPILPD